MDRQTLINLVKTTTNSFEDYPFNGVNSHEKIIWTAMKQVSNKKIIALIFEKDNELMIDLKLEPQHGEIMRNRIGVYPGYHMNKAHWNTILVNKTDVSKNELINMIKESDRLTL
ncbi:MmcQ/YjbR family DNA-binding protein [Weissella bombi]|uniref:Predicted DNA-binding protein, MmcQ/YjbR family n=1 Tax=Weissella bombi TaxID=1505725 RepID=A0A1C3YUP2_9LACO|nr:MmcQ/YjbR family DNA-binding protein [Weissella bombi]SCB73831.1 Predicted DNA-binding protein, MmcQ/YjbR family [Weissella bombi]